MEEEREKEREEKNLVSIRALEGSRAAKWTPRKGAPKEEEDEGMVGGEGREDRR